MCKNNERLSLAEQLSKATATLTILFSLSETILFFDMNDYQEWREVLHSEVHILSKCVIYEFPSII